MDQANEQCKTTLPDAVETLEKIDKTTPYKVKNIVRLHKAVYELAEELFNDNVHEALPYYLKIKDYKDVPPRA